MPPHKPVLYETHMHTPLCKHAVGLPGEYAATAEGRGLAGIVVTDHNPMPDRFAYGVRMDESELPRYLELVAEARAEWAGRVDVRVGLECDFFHGYEGYLEKQIGSQPWDYILGSVHPHLSEYRATYPMDDPVVFQCQYFTLLAEAAETRLFDCLTHPDLVKMMTPTQWDLPVIMPHIERCLDRIVATGTAMELNTSGAYKRGYPEMNPGPIILQACVPVMEDDTEASLSARILEQEHILYPRAVAMIAEYRESLQQYGPWFYRPLFWECGTVGQILYLEAEAAGIRGTGIGCFFDDLSHEYLGLEGDGFQVLYHFTVGGPVEDDRLQTFPPYESPSRLKGP